MRAFLALVLIALALPPASAQELSRKITFNAPAARAKLLLVGLSREAGVPILTSQVVENEVLFIHVKNQPLSEVMKRIAEAADAEWEKEGSGFRLVRPDALKRRIVNEELAERTDEMRKAIGDAVKAADKDNFDSSTAQIVATQMVAALKRRGGPNFDEQSREHLARLDAKTPVGRLFPKALAAMDPRDLAAIPPSGRAVFSTTPNAMQKPIRGDLKAALASHMAEQNIWAKEVENAAGDDPNLMLHSRLSKTILTSTKGLKAILVFTRDSGSTRMTTELIVADGHRRISSIQGQFNATALTNERPPIAELNKEPAPELSQLTQEVVSRSVLKEGEDEQVRPPMSAELRSVLASPETIDPLSLGPSEALQCVAKHRSLNVVANLNDRMLFVYYYLEQKQLSPSMILWLARVVHGYEIEEQSGWITMKPHYRMEARESHVDRVALGRLCRTTLKGNPSLDDLAVFLLSYASRETSAATTLYLNLISPENANMLWSSNGEVLRLYGLIPHAARQQSRAGAALKIGELPTDARAQIHRMVYGKGSSYSLVGNSDDELYATFLAFEPTEAFPTGLPPETTVMLREIVEEVPFARWGNTLRGFTPQELAMEILAKELPDRFGDWGRQGSGKYFYGSRRRITCAIQLPPYARMDHTLTESSVDTTKAPMTLDQMPESYRKEVARMVDHHRKTAVPGPGGKPPPPLH